MEFKDSCSARARMLDKVVLKVISVLSPLISSARSVDLQRELHILVNSAIEVWNDAQSGNLKITINQLLENMDQEEWRPQEFDPALPSSSHSEVNFDLVSRTRPRILTLFSQVVAWGKADLAMDRTNPPGSFPLDSTQAPRTLETYIHPGRGLPKWSPPVIRQDRRNEKNSKTSSTRQRRTPIVLGVF